MRGLSSERARLAFVSGGLAMLAGCVAVPPPQPAPLVVLPGQQKTYAEFQRDDAACRPGGPAALPTAAPNLNAEPHLAYVQCMASRGNNAVPVPQVYPYPAYTYGYTSYYPWVYGPAFWGGYGLGIGFGAYYGSYYRYGWGGYGGRYGGYGHYGGYRGYGHYGGYGGYRGGSAYAGNGFGGGFHGGGGGRR